jgi:hypothetical protein
MSIRRWCYNRFVNSLDVVYRECRAHRNMNLSQAAIRIVWFTYRSIPAPDNPNHSLIKVSFEVATTAPTTLIYISWMPFDIIETSTTVGSRIVCTSPWVWVVVLSTGDYQEPPTVSRHIDLGLYLYYRKPDPSLSRLLYGINKEYFYLFEFLDHNTVFFNLSEAKYFRWYAMYTCICLHNPPNFFVHKMCVCVCVTANLIYISPFQSNQLRELLIELIEEWKFVAPCRQRHLSIEKIYSASYDR